jgi:acetyltransferase-like isoleucine patch superfamily enzyme
MISILKLKRMLGYLKHYYYDYDPSEFGQYGLNVEINKPFVCNNPKNVYLGNNVRLRPSCTIITHTGKFIIKDHSEASNNLMVVTGNHGWTNGIGKWQTDLNLSQELDVEKDIVIENDVWIGANVTLLAGVTIGRGCIIAAGCVVTKSTKPYTIYGGVPGHPLKAKYTIDEILKHEELLYKEEDRYTRDELEKIFTEK